VEEHSWWGARGHMVHLHLRKWCMAVENMGKNYRKQR